MAAGVWKPFDPKVRSLVGSKWLYQLGGEYYVTAAQDVPERSQVYWEGSDSFGHYSTSQRADTISDEGWYASTSHNVPLRYSQGTWVTPKGELRAVSNDCYMFFVGKQLPEVNMPEPYGTWVKYDAETMTINKCSKWLCFDGKDYLVIRGSDVPDSCALYMEDGYSFGANNCCIPATASKPGWYLSLDYSAPIYRTEADEWRDIHDIPINPPEHSGIWYFAPTLCDSLEAAGIELPRSAASTDDVAVKHDDNKPRVDLIPPDVLFQVGAAFGFGDEKYEAYNYLKGMDHHRMFRAAKSHLDKYWMGEDLDPESGLPHLAHACASVMMLMSSINHGVGTDDRPPALSPAQIAKLFEGCQL